MSKMICGSQVAAVLAQLREPEPSSLGELVGRMRCDYQVLLADRVLSSQGNQAKVSVTCEEGDQRARILAGQLENLFYKTRSSMWDMLAFGRVCYEKQWAASERSGLDYIHRLEPLPFEDSEMLPPVNGRYAGCKIGDQLTLPPRYSWWLALDATAKHPHGRSRYTQAPYYSWRDRAELRRLRRIFIEKYCLKGAVFHGPEQIERDGQRIDVFSEVGKVYAQYQSGGLACFPGDRQPGPNGDDGDYVFDLKEMPGETRDAGPLIDLKNDMDAEQLLAFGIPPKTVIEGNAVGSFALVTQQMLILLSVAEEIVEQQVNSFQEFIIQDAVDVNFVGGNKPLIVANFTPLAQRPDDLAVEIVKAWLTTPNLSPLVLSGIDIEAVLDICGVPVTKDAKGRVKELLAAAARIQAAAAPTSQSHSVSMAVDHPFLTRTR